MKIKIAFATLAASIAFAASGASATEQQQMVLTTSQTALMVMEEAPGTVVVGNPGIADVTIEGKQVFLHGRDFGTTNMMFFDAGGKLTRQLEVVVQVGASDQVTVYRGPQSYSFVCVRDCQPILKPGDDHDWISNIAGDFGLVQARALGMKPSDGASTGSGAPPPAQ